jgi:hypothetical protein
MLSPISPRLPYGRNSFSAWLRLPISHCGSPISRAAYPGSLHSPNAVECVSVCVPIQ